MPTPAWLVLIQQEIENILVRFKTDNINALQILEHTTAKIIHQSTNDKEEGEKIILESLPYKVLHHYRDLRLSESTNALVSPWRTSSMDDQQKRNLRHWSALFHTDPAQTQNFSRPGGFKGTGIKPTFFYTQLTALFGPLGIGWGHEKPDFRFEEEEGHKFVFCTVECWYKDDENGRTSIWGTGGDLLVKKDSRGAFPDDDAPKKALTDAIGNAFSRLGAGADIRMGLHNDNKYTAKTNAAFRAANSEYLPGGENKPSSASNSPQNYNARPTEVVRPPPLKIGGK